MLKIYTNGNTHIAAKSKEHANSIMCSLCGDCMDKYVDESWNEIENLNNIVEAGLVEYEHLLKAVIP